MFACAYSNDRVRFEASLENLNQSELSFEPTAQHEIKLLLEFPDPDNWVLNPEKPKVHLRLAAQTSFLRTRFQF